MRFHCPTVVSWVPWDLPLSQWNLACRSLGDVPVAQRFHETLLCHKGPLAPSGSIVSQSSPGSHQALVCHSGVLFLLGLTMSQWHLCPVGPTLPKQSLGSIRFQLVPVLC